MSNNKLCANIAYKITPINHPIVKDGKFHCKHCDNEVVPTERYHLLVWIHKEDM